MENFFNLISSVEFQSHFQIVVVFAIFKYGKNRQQLLIFQIQQLSTFFGAVPYLEKSSNMAKIGRKTLFNTCIQPIEFPCSNIARISGNTRDPSLNSMPNTIWRTLLTFGQFEVRCQSLFIGWLQKQLALWNVSKQELDHCTQLMHGMPKSNGRGWSFSQGLHQVFMGFGVIQLNSLGNNKKYFNILSLGNV